MKALNQICSIYNSQAVNHRISFVFIASALIVFTVILISFTVQLANIQHNQEEIPAQFFSTFNKKSLELVTNKTKSLILAIIDYRISLITITKNSLINSAPQRPNPHYQLQQSHPQQPNILSCLMANSTRSMFNCSWDMYTKHILESSWTDQQKSHARRFNLIYQNLQDPSDIMAKSISSSPDFRIINKTKVGLKLEELKQGYIHIASLYRDQYGNTQQLLWAFRTKLVFPTFQVLIQLETFSFIKDPISRVLYSQQTNVVVLAKNNQEAQKYKIVAKLSQLSLDINFTNLLGLGHAESTLPNSQKIYSYTQSMSSTYKMEQQGLNDSSENNTDFVIIVHSVNICKQLQVKTFQLIHNLHRSLNEILLLFFFLILAILIVNSLVVCLKIGRVLNGVKEMIQRYSENPQNQYQIIDKMVTMSLKDDIIRPIVRNLGNAIRNIEEKKRRFKNKCKQKSMDVYPLNLYESDFQQKHKMQDRKEFQKLRAALMKKDKGMRGS